MTRSIGVLLAVLLLAGLPAACDSSGPESEGGSSSGGGSPAARGGAPAVWLNGPDRMMLFGGMSPITGDTWQLATDDNAWQEILPDDGAAPAARCHHTLVSGRASGQAFLFGGFTRDTRFNDTWRFDPAQQAWQELSVSGAKPAPRCLQAGAYVDGASKMFVHGGVSGAGSVSGDFFADTWLLDLDTRTWTEVDTETGPAERRGAVAFYSSEEGAVFLWGGKQVEAYPTQLWAFDLDTKEWSVVETDGDVPTGREDPTVFWNEEVQVLYVTHGLNDTRSNPHVGGAYELDLAARTWTQLPDQEGPARRWRASATFDPKADRGSLFGGWVGFNEENLDDTWSYNFDTREWTQMD